MCNSCNCSQDMADHCSILGSMPAAFCCENCIGYENRMSCENFSQYVVRTFADSDHLKVVSETETEEKAIEKEQDDNVTLIINKRR